MSNLDFSDHIPIADRNSAQFIYNSSSYLNQLDSTVKSFFALRKDTKELALAIHFQIEDQHAISLREAPFGSLEITSSTIKQDIKDFMQFAIGKLRQINMTNITVKSAPPCYFRSLEDDSELLTEYLGFSHSKVEINHHLEICNQMLTDRMHDMQKRRLQKCMNAGFDCVELPQKNLKEVFEFISKCRVEKSHTLSISLKKLESLTAALPESYLLFGCYDKGQLIAASICVVVNSKILYNFLPASDPLYNKYSPMVMLVSSIYDYCYRNEFEVLDLGTSMLDNQPNVQLIDFKNRIGGIETGRSIYTLML